MLLAVLKVLQGEQVDIITSNPVLAEDAIKEKSDFFMFYLVFKCFTQQPKSGCPFYIQGKKKSVITMMLSMEP